MSIFYLIKCIFVNYSLFFIYFFSFIMHFVCLSTIQDAAEFYLRASFPAKSFGDSRETIQELEKLIEEKKNENYQNDCYTKGIPNNT